jgi:aminopeptidase N
MTGRKLMQPVRSFRALTFVLLCALVAPTAALAQQPRPSASRELPATRYIPSHDYDVQDIKLELRFDWEKEQAFGTETITLQPLVSDLRQVDLDAVNMTFNSVRWNGAALKFDTDKANEKLRITLDRPYQPGETIRVVIDYHTNGTVDETGIASFGRGLTFIKPTSIEPNRPRQIWSQGETEYNHYWFACYDHPNDFSTTEIIATVEKPLMVISNGKLISTKENKDNTRTYDWKIDEAHASYLTSIVVGEYTALDGSYAGIPVTSYVYPNEVAEGKASTSRLPEMVKFFSEKTGVKYPYAKYAQTMVRDFGGGMENISATTQTDNMIHDARTEIDRTSDGLQSHELAHQWFGDYVTCRSWSDVWLNESFATYFQAMWDEQSLGRDDFLFRDVISNQNDYYADWARGVRRPIVTKNYTDPDAVFDNYAYPRGGAVLHMLRMTLGEKDWWRSINHYLTKNAHQPVSTDQFRIAIEETTGQSMDWFFDEWLYKMGHPVFRVTQAYDPAAKSLTLTVRQEQKPDPESKFPQASLFRTIADIEIGTATGTRVERIWIEPKEEQTFTFRVDAEPLLVNFDHGDTLIKELRFDKSITALIYQLTHDTDLTGRVWALGQLEVRRRDQATSVADQETIIQAIASSLAQDQFWGLRFETAKALQNVPGTTAKNALLAAVHDMDPHVRARAIESLGALEDPQLADTFRLSLTDQSYTVIGAAAAALGQTKNPAGYEQLVKLLDTPSWRDNLRIAGLNGLAVLGDARSLETAFKYAGAGNRATVRAAALTLLAAVGKDDPRTFPIISEAFTKSVSPFEYAIFGPAGRALVELGDPRAAELFAQAAPKLESPRAKAQMQTFVDQLKQKSPPAAAKTP